MVVSCAWVGETHSQIGAGPPAVPVPSEGNVSVARLVLQAVKAGGAIRAPRLALANGRTLPAGASVLATVARGTGGGRFVATVVVIRPSLESGSPVSSRPTRPISLTIPRGFTVVSAKQANDVLHQNVAPGFPLVVGGTASMLAGKSPKLPPVQIVKDAQLLALDRSIPLADLGLLRLRAVAAAFGTLGTSLKVSIGLSGLGQVNAVELKFPQGTRVMRTTGPQDTDGLPMGTGVQLIASRGFFQDGQTYEFTLELNQAPKKGDVVLVRASTHYFESSLPFTDRLVLG